MQFVVFGTGTQSAQPYYVSLAFVETAIYPSFEYTYSVGLYNQVSVQNILGYRPAEFDGYTETREGTTALYLA